MSPGHNCRAVRQRWMTAFDERREADVATLAHLQECGDCAAFARSTEVLRTGIPGAATAPADLSPGAERALLGAWRSAARRGQGSPFWHARLAGAMLTGFALTIALGHALMPGDAPEFTSPPSASAPFSAAELDDWVARTEPLALRPGRRPAVWTPSADPGRSG